MITITILMKESSLCEDIQVNENQKLIETFHILAEKGILPMVDRINLHEVKSERKQQYCNVRLSYAQLQIYNGDILQLSYERKR